MSYLVDALKKAERERHENQRADLRSLAEGGPGPGSGGSGRALRWLVGLLVVCNAALLAYLFVPTRVSEAFVEPAPTVVSSAGETQAPSSPESAAETDETGAQASGPVAKSSGENTERAPAQSNVGARATAAPQEAPERLQARGSDQSAPTAPSSPTLPPAKPRPMENLRLSNDAPRAGGGQVTYSRTPLDDAPSSRPPGPQPNAPAPRGSAPAVAINGHLFSTVPGRSFILVNGRRYHEGERLAEGPAVESIDATGATLNYRGDRYHVKGPS
ncbi:general secretion pathway protein GspB [Endozoicomonas sp. G2_2]|uniref:general secretion pathway protein GspB n=1 Tax=Endozoicomonas sp. G2_2 TaxID=2821092 RepID=UPI001ADB9E56|nr:general secretion pathway protein GspB [Endozoicomonas sp. G2_2]